MDGANQDPRSVSCDDTFSVVTNIKSGAGWRNEGKCTVENV